jgi:hypothetical protein
MTSPADIYKTLFAGKRLEVACNDRKAYESLRVQLCQQHQTPKLLLELTDDSLCASYNAATGIGTFWIGTPRKSVKPADFKIVGESDA